MKTQTKLIIRKLPRGLTKDQFLANIHPYNKFNYFRFCDGEKLQKEFSCSRAYIDFVTEDSMYKFKNDFENKLFADDDGNESYAIIEFAGFQMIPAKDKIDSKQNSIAGDLDFVKFVQEINSVPKNVNIGTVESNLEEIKNKEVDKARNTTALIDFITKLPKKERVRKDEYRRKSDYQKSFIKKDDEGIVDAKTNIKTSRKNNVKENSTDLCMGVEYTTISEKNELKKPKPTRRNDIKTYAANYKEFVNDYETYADERSPKRGFENTYYRGGRPSKYEEVEEARGGSGSYYHNMRSDAYYRGYDYYGYTDNSPVGHSRPLAKNRRGDKARPPSYSATRKD